MLLVPKEGNIETSYDQLRDSWVDFLLVRYHYLKNESTCYLYEGCAYITCIQNFNFSTRNLTILDITFNYNWQMVFF